MNDCITRADAVKAACKLCPLICKNAEVCPTRDVVVGAIPAVDARPAKEGHWIRHISDLFPADSTIECDQCHAEQPIWIDDNFCPNCGAKMRGADR